MPSSFTPSLRFELQFDGENTNTWGDKLNVLFGHADYAIAGWLTKAVSGDYALTTSNLADDEARAAMLKFTGGPAANWTLTIPPVSKTYFIYNATAKAVTVTTGAGATVTIDDGDKICVFCDGGAVHTLSFGGLDLKAYITASMATAGAVPSPIGNAGKYLFSDGANVLWRQPSTADLSDYARLVLGVQVALAVAL